MHTASADEVSKELLDLLACSQCRLALTPAAGLLRCTSCGKTYEVKQGIPVMIPDDVDREHLEEEHSLAAMMKSREDDPRMKFNLEQWTRSKIEFWSMVRARIRRSPAKFVNIGCGFDTSFAEFERMGHTFVNFDLVFDMLTALRNETGAKDCVNGDVHSLPFKPGAFDYVVSIDVIHHETEKLFDLLRSFRDLLKPNGTLFLEDPNAWGLFQIPKSILMPRFLYRWLRSAYHGYKRSVHRPADYEFPTNVYSVVAMLRELGFTDIKCHPNSAYPTIGERSYRLYHAINGFEFVRKFHNYHYMLSATRS